MKIVAVLDSTFAIRKRIKALAAKANIEVVEVVRPEQLISLLNASNEIGLVISELEFRPEDGFEIINKIKASAGTTPVMILTAENRRLSFVKAMQIGVTDYVLKPFDGEYLMKRIISLMEAGHECRHSDDGKTASLKIDSPSVDLNSYLDKEFKKASKGNYPVSVVLSVITDPENKLAAALENRQHQILNLMPTYFSEVLFDTDIFVSYGPRTYIGVFPFCGSENQGLISVKLHQVFQDFKRENDIENTIQLISVFSSHPEDGYDRDMLLQVLNERLAAAVR